MGHPGGQLIPEGSELNAVEIELAITDLAEQPFDGASFPYAFLEAFSKKATAIQRLRSGVPFGKVYDMNPEHNIQITTSRQQKSLD